ncbi:MAG: leucine-rich repeat protein [Clostridia bacterium]|nr:leucine-rich repeat protein [Clostridia bacterium]
MKLNVTKIVSVICALMMIVPSVLGTFIYYSPVSVSAAQAPERPYTPLSDGEALALIGWLSDKSKVTDEMKSAGNIYDFLTGKLEYGSDKEVAARFAFCAFAAAGINKNLDQASNQVSVTTDYLIDYLNERAGEDAGEEISDDIFKEFKSSVSGVLQYYLDVDESTIDTLDCIKSGYTDILSAPGKGKQLAKDITAGFAAFFYIGAQNKRAQYTYVATKIKNMSSRAYSNPAVADIIDSYNSMANANNNMFATLSGSNSWNKEENKALLDTFAKFISDANDTTGYSAGSSTVVQVHCPTDVTVTDGEGNVIVRIKDDTVEVCAAGQFAAVRDSQKLIVLADSEDCSVTVTGTDAGTMDYTVSSYNDGGLIRQIGFEDVPVSKDSVHEGAVPADLYAETEEFSLTCSTGEVISATFDSLPHMETDTADSVVYDESTNKFPAEVIDLLGAALYNMEPVADIEEYAISSADISLLFSAVSKKYPCEYSLIGKFSYRASILKSSMVIKNFEFFYGEGADLSKYQKKVETLKSKIESIVSLTDGMSDFEKALYLHDYVVLNCQYDKELAALLSEGKITGEVYTDRYTEYGVLNAGKGICGSYAKAYEALMNAAGVECIYLSSSKMNHAWNLVKLDGEWYHVDVCWDDPTPDREGLSGRDYFLLNDAEIRRLDHTGWTPSRYVSTSKAFSNMPRKNDGLQKYYDNKWYFYENGSVYSCNIYGGEREELFSAKLSSLDVDGSYVYYTAADCIYRYSLESEKTELVYILAYDSEEIIPEGAAFKNIFVRGDSLRAYLTYIDGEGNKKTLTVTDTVDFARYTAVSGITLDKTELSLDVFGTATLAATIISNTGTEGLSVLWSSSDESIVTVDSLGNVTANNIGEATLTARFLDFYSVCTVTVSGDGKSGTCGSGVTWSFDGESGTLTVSGSGKMTSHPWDSLKDQIKSVVIEDGVLSLAGDAFSNCKNLRSVTLAEGISEIGTRAFSNCQKLSYMVIPDSVTTLGSSCFAGCTVLSAVTLSKNIQQIQGSTFERCLSLQYIEIPDGVKEIYQWAFWMSGLREVVLPDSVEYIGERAFAVCSDLETVTLGKGVKTVLHNAIYETPALEKITVAEDNPYLTSDEKGALYSKDKSALIKYPDNPGEKNVILPDGIVSVERNAFAYGSVKSLSLPDSVKTIGIDAFVNCRELESVDFGEGLESVGDGAFCFCTSLEKADLPDTLTTLGAMAFRGCTSLVSVDLGNSLSTAGSDTFLDCTAIESVTVPASLKVIPQSFMQGCTSLSSLTLEEGITCVGFHSFNGCSSLEAVTIPESVTEIDSGAFSECSSLSEVYIPRAVTELEASSFANCSSLESITVSEENANYTSEDGVLFNKGKTELITCPAGKKICTIPKTVNTIDIYYAFYETMAVEAIEVDSGNESFSSIDGVLYSADGATLLYYPGARKNKVYKLPESVREIDYSAFSGCDSLETVVFTESLDSLSESFYGCPNLKTIVFEEKVDMEGCFMWLEYIERVIIKNRDFAPEISYAPYAYGMSEERLPVYVHEGSDVFNASEWSGITAVNMDAVPHEHVYYLYDHTPVTDTEDGKLVYQCYCGDEYSEIEHRFGETVAVAPSCIAGEEYRVCENCGEKEVLNTYPENGIHSYAVIAFSEGDCTTPPEKTYECVYCKDRYTVAAGLAAHKYEETVVAPTCTENGYTVSECTECGEYSVDSFIACHGHSLIIEEGDGGYTYTCSECDYYYSDEGPEEDLFNLGGAILAAEDRVNATLSLTSKDNSSFEERTVEAAGEYLFDSLPAGTYILRAEAEGYYVFEEEVTVSTDSERDIILIKEGTPILGDISFDGEINAKDSNLLKQVLAGVITVRGETAMFFVTDINSDGEINAKDSNLLKQVLAGVITVRGETAMFFVTDINSDGEINAKDSNLLKQIIAGVVK